jgi:hypothetical protein
MLYRPGVEELPPCVFPRLVKLLRVPLLHISKELLNEFVSDDLSQRDIDGVSGGLGT